MTRNLGQVALGRRRRRGDRMRDFDALPPPLRQWLRHAALPWSPASCLRIWRATHAKGGDAAEALARLEAAQAATLERESGKSGRPRV